VATEGHGVPIAPLKQQRQAASSHAELRHFEMLCIPEAMQIVRSSLAEMEDVRLGAS
jgi:hypothetical protein